jgi:hypothetical protein
MFCPLCLTLLTIASELGYTNFAIFSKLPTFPHRWLNSGMKIHFLPKKGALVLAGELASA